MKRILIFLIVFPYFLFGQTANNFLPKAAYNLQFSGLPKRWDEALPIGNGTLGALVWQKDTNLRMSLDRADLWDTRPMKGLDRPEFSYKWVAEQVEKKQYNLVQKYFDEPYEREPAPTKLPGAAIEFIGKNWGTPISSSLDIQNGEVTVKYTNKVNVRTFVHANKDIGWFRLENVDTININLIAPNYVGISQKSGGSVEGDDLSRLGYPKGKFSKTKFTKYYEQEIGNGKKYGVIIRWRKLQYNNYEGSWAIVYIRDSTKNDVLESASSITNSYLKELKDHTNWWSDFWKKSAIHLPDSVLERQYYLDMYKFGSVARRGSPPISLQAIWTADNGKLPPWKGDFHHDLNTEMSYWPAYKSNHLKEAYSLLDHLDNNWDTYQKYTQKYFGVNGLNVPGVSTINGEPMGGWIQYALSPTTAAWLAQNYYLQWRYTKNRRFLDRRCYPWIKETARFLEQILQKNKDGFLQLPISSSPEIHDNSIHAWFKTPTNYDNALIHFVFEKGAELAKELQYDRDKIRFDSIYQLLPPLEIDGKMGFLIAKDQPLKESHRHFSHLMAIHPLGLMHMNNLEDQKTIRNSLANLDKLGTDNWTGYSFSWLGNLKARAKDGEGAAKALKIFAEAFCSVNSFHLNGDQSKKGYSKINYRPFTLEGNFAFASGIQEMLLQSQDGMIEVFPAIPESWKNVSFENLRAEGAILVSAAIENGTLDNVKFTAESSGDFYLKLPFKTWFVDQKEQEKVKLIENNVLKISLNRGATIVIKNGYE